MAEFHEAWFSTQSQKALTRLARRTGSLSGRVVEVGCWEGRSTCALAHAVWPACVDAVDTWQGSPGEISRDLAEQRDVYATFTENIADLTRGNVNVHRMGWRDYFAADDSPVRFCHSDATHTYEEVRDNIEAVLALLVPGGVICGDDALHPPVIAAARDTLPEVHLEASLWWWQRGD